jgi:hypothetical protein
MPCESGARPSCARKRKPRPRGNGGNGRESGRELGLAVGRRFAMSASEEKRVRLTPPTLALSRTPAPKEESARLDLGHLPEGKERGAPALPGAGKCVSTNRTRRAVVGRPDPQSIRRPPSPALPPRGARGAGEGSLAHRSNDVVDGARVGCPLFGFRHDRYRRRCVSGATCASSRRGLSTLCCSGSVAGRSYFAVTPCLGPRLRHQAPG